MNRPPTLPSTEERDVVNRWNYRALLIGNSSYPDDPHNLRELEGPRTDPAMLRDALCDDRYGLFPSNNVRLVVERESAEILKEVEDFFQRARHDDSLLLYYSGHGRLDRNSELYLCARNSRVDRLRTTALRASDLRAMIDDSPAATTVIILDCCHSGAFKGGSLAEALSGRGRFVLTSCRRGELADDSSTTNQASPFTFHLVEGLLGRVADRNDDGFVELEDLYHYTYEKLRAVARQTPERSFAGSGSVPVARRPRRMAAPILDVSPTEIVLKGVEIGENLPVERVAIVNRGGGELKWSADCAADWVALQADRHGLVLRLQPVRPGTNRANLHVSDEVTGRFVTVRLVVHVAWPTTPPPTSEPIKSHEPEVPPNDGRPVIALTNAGIRWIHSAITRPSDWQRKLRHSLWLLSTVPMGLTTWIGFLYVGRRARRRAWMWIAAMYGMATVVLFAFMMAAPTDSEGRIDQSTWQANVGAGSTLVLWIVGTIHAIVVNQEWLRWRASASSPQVVPVEAPVGNGPAPDNMAPATERSRDAWRLPG